MEDLNIDLEKIIHEKVAIINKIMDELDCYDHVNEILLERTEQGHSL